jgi:hypothetical protein
MKRFWGLALGLTLVGSTAAGPPEVAPPPKSTAQVLAKLQKDVADSYNRAIEPLRKAQQVNDPAEKKKLQDEFSKLYTEHQKFESECQAKAVAIAKAEAQTEVGLDAAIWAAPGRKPPERKELVNLVIEYHMTSKKIANVLGLLTREAVEEPAAKDRAKALDTMELIVTKSPHKSVQAAAVFYKNKAEPYGRKAPTNSEELSKKAEAGFERVLKEYGDVVQYGKRTFGDAAKTTLYEIRNLRVGKTVPEIEGEDVDGAKFKISDYRGKVVMLDFWGHW